MPAAANLYTFDEALQSEAYRIGQEAIIKTLEGKVYAHGKVSLAGCFCINAATCTYRLRETPLRHPNPLSYTHTAGQ